MKIYYVLLISLALFAGCKKDTQTGGEACPDWYEGANCQTPMRQKWVGTFIGLRHTNASVPGIVDTFTFVTDPTRIDYNRCSNKNFDLSIRNTREASIPHWYPGSTVVWDPIHQDSVLSLYGETGIGIVSEDGKYATLTYTVGHLYVNFQLTIDSIPPDSSVLYTFEGTKQ